MNAPAPAYCYDSACQDLAEHFLPDGPETAVKALAQEIQDTIERWLSFDDESPEREDAP